MFLNEEFPRPDPIVLDLLLVDAMELQLLPVVGRLYAASPVLPRSHAPPPDNDVWDEKHATCSALRPAGESGTPRRFCHARLQP